MKKLFVSFLVVATLVSCGKDNQFKISGTAENIADGTEVFIQKQDTLTGEFVSVDTVRVMGNKFVFEGESLDPSITFLEVKKVNGKFPFVLEEGKIEIIVNKDTIQKSKVSGTISNDHLTEYNKDAEVITKKIKKFQEENLAKWQTAVSSNDTITRNQLIEQNKNIQNEFLVLTKAHIEKNPKSYLSLIFISQLMYHPDGNPEELLKYHNSLSDKLKNTTEGKKQIKELNKIAEEKKKVSNQQ